MAGSRQTGPRASYGGDQALVDVLGDLPAVQLLGLLAGVAESIADVTVRVVAEDDRADERGPLVGRLVVQPVQAGRRIVAELRPQRAGERLAEVRPGAQHERDPRIGDDVAGRRHAMRRRDEVVRDRGEGRQLRGVQTALAHSGTCCSKRVSTMWSAARSASATIDDVGFTPAEVTNELPSTT